MCLISPRHDLNSCVHRHCAQPHLTMRPFLFQSGLYLSVSYCSSFAPVFSTKRWLILLRLWFGQIQMPPVTLASSKVTKVTCAQTPHWSNKTIRFFFIFVSYQWGMIGMGQKHLQLKTTSVYSRLKSSRICCSFINLFRTCCCSCFTFSSSRCRRVDAWRDEQTIVFYLIYTHSKLWRSRDCIFLVFLIISPFPCFCFLVFFKENKGPNKDSSILLNKFFLKKTQWALKAAQSEQLSSPHTSSNLATLLLPTLKCVITAA